MKWTARRAALPVAFVALLLVLASSEARAGERPTVAVLSFGAKAGTPWYYWWQSRGAEAAQALIVTELVKSGRFRVLESQHLAAVLREEGWVGQADPDATTCNRIGRLLAARYLLTGDVVALGSSEAWGGHPDAEDLGVRKQRSVAKLAARLFDAETGAVVWSAEASAQAQSTRFRAGGFSGGRHHHAPFETLLRPVVEQLVEDLRGADLSHSAPTTAAPADPP